VAHLDHRRSDHRRDAPVGGLLTRRAAIARLAALGLAVPALATSTAGTAGAFPRPDASPEARAGLVHRGISYDTGWGGATGELSRLIWQTALMEREIAAIRDELHCTSISVHGTDLDRLRAAATHAADLGLDVWIQPRLTYAPRPDTIDHMVETARTAEALRRQGASVTMTLGAEHPLLAGEIIPGATFDEQVEALIGNPRQWPAYMKGVNDLLADAVAGVRGIFAGPLTYGAAPDEAVEIDWSIFDVVGLNHYLSADNRATYVEDLRAFRRFGKPLVITEFGSCSYEGANEAGGMGWDVYDREKDPPEIRPGLVRSEQVQADYIAELLAIFAAEQVHGAFVYTFTEEAPHSPDPRYDYDMASYGIIKIYLDGSARSYDKTGYWEPKLAFHEIARIYGAG
jgi:hypothetical protein